MPNRAESSGRVAIRALISVNRGSDPADSQKRRSQSRIAGPETFAKTAWAKNRSSRRAFGYYVSFSRSGDTSQRNTPAPGASGRVQSIRAIAPFVRGSEPAPVSSSTSAVKSGS